MPSLTRLPRFLSLVGALALAACSDAASPVADSASIRVDGQNFHLVKCTTDQVTTANALVLPLIGGTVTAGGSSITIPAGGLLDAQTIAVTVPASKYMEIDVSALGLAHLLFEQPATITLDYSRCSDDSLARGPLSVWYIDPLSHRPLENMHGVDDRATHRITFSTGHLSGYAIAN